MQRAPYQRGLKVDELVDRLTKCKSVFLYDLKLSIDDLVLPQKLTPVSHFQKECLTDL